MANREFEYDGYNVFVIHYKIEVDEFGRKHTDIEFELTDLQTGLEVIPDDNLEQEILDAIEVERDKDD